MENYLKDRVPKRGSKEIKSLYMPEEEIGNEPKDVEEVHYIKETLQVRKVVRKLNEDNV